MNIQKMFASWGAVRKYCKTGGGGVPELQGVTLTCYLSLAVIKRRCATAFHICKIFIRGSTCCTCLLAAGLPLSIDRAESR